MRLTDEMISQDDQRFLHYNVRSELKYCGKEITNRKSITNDNIRFQAWLCRRADEIIEEQRNKISDLMDIIEQRAGCRQEENNK